MIGDVLGGLRRPPWATPALAALVGVALVAGLLTRSALAGPSCETEWRSAVSGEWKEEADWTNGLPSGSKSACITKAGSYTVTVTGTREVGSLTVSGGSGGPVLELQANATNGDAVLIAHGESENGATIKLTDPESSGGGNTARLEMASGTLVNEGRIVSEPGSAGLGERIVNGALTNGAGGKIEVRQSLSIDRGAPATFATAGTVKVESGKILYVDHSGTPGTFAIEAGKIEDEGTIYDHTVGPNQNSDGGHGTLEAKGGTLSGKPVLAVGVTANLSGSGSGTFQLGGAANSLAGAKIAAGYTLVLYALNENGFDDAVATDASGILNEGRIELTEGSSESPYPRDARLEMEAGAALTNEGTIVSEPGATGEGTRTLNGALTNGAGGKIEVRQSLSIDRGAPATFATAGTVKVESGKILYVDHSGTPGTFAIEAGKIEDEGTIYDHTVGPNQNSDGGHGTLEAKGGTLSGKPVLAVGVTANLSGSGSGTFQLGGAANSLAGAKIAAGYTLVLYALNENGFDDAVATDASGILNEGRIELTEGSSESPYPRDARLEMEAGAALTNEGTIVSEPGATGEGTRTLNGALTNGAGGKIEVRQSLSIDRGAPATFATAGTVKVESGKILYVDHSGTPGTFAIEAGKIEDEGTIYDHTVGPNQNSDGGHGTLEAKGGTLSGNPVLAVGVTANLSGSGSGTFQLGGAANSLAGAKIAAGYTLEPYALNENGFDDAVVTASSSFTNDGTIDLTNAENTGESQRDSRLVVASGTLTNHGTIVADAGAHGQGVRMIEGNLINASDGTIDVEAKLFLDEGPAATFATSGTVDVAAGGTLYVDHSGTPGTFAIEAGKIEDEGTIYDHTLGPNQNSDGGHGTLEAKGGTLSGNPVLAVGVTANLSGSGSGTFQLGGAANSLAGAKIAAGYTLVLYALNENGFDDAVATDASGILNEGRIELTEGSSESPYPRDARLEMEAGAALTNEGTIVSEPGATGEGTRTLNGALTNGAGGKIEVRQSLSIGSGGALTTAGAVTVASGARLAMAGSYTQSAGSTELGGATATLAPGGQGTVIEGGALSGPGTVEGSLSNAGRIAVASASPGTLAVTGNYQQSTPGVLAVGVTPSGADQLHVAGSATVAGKLSVTTAGGFTPALGSSYEVLKRGSGSGAFSQATGLVSGPYSVSYGEAGVTLTAVLPSDFPAFSIGDASVVRGSGDVQLTFTVTLSQPVVGGASVEYASEDGSARAPGDYAATGGTLTFAGGETSKTVSVVVHGNTAPGANETMYVNLNNAQNALINREHATGTIVNDNMTLTSVSPASAGNLGQVTVEFVGSGFTHDQTVALARQGEPTLTPVQAKANAQGTAITATFEFSGAAQGAWTPVVSIPGGPSVSLPGGLTINARSPASISVELLGAHWTAGNYPWTGILQYTNTGNVDATDAVVQVDGFNRGAEVKVASPPGAERQFSVLPRRGPADSGVTIMLPLVPAQSTGDLLITFTPVGGETDVYRLRAATLLSSGSSPPGAPASATFTGELLSQEGASFAALLHVSSPSVSGDMHVALTAKSPYHAGALQYTTAPEGNGLTHYQLVGEVPPPAGQAPPDARPGFAPAQAAGSGEYTAEQGARDTLSVSTGGAVLSTAQAVVGANDTYLAYNEQQREEQIGECLVTLGLINQQQHDEAKRLAEANTFAQGINGAMSYIPGFGSIGAKELNALTAVTNTAWSNYMFGNEAFGSPGALQGIGGPYAEGFVGMTPAQQYAFVTQELCSEGNPPNHNHRLTPETFNHERERFIPGTPAYELALRVPGDPNEITGPAGYGKRHYLTPHQPLTYEISFENKPTATASASEVKISDRLDPHKVNLATLALGSLYIGEHALKAPPGSSSWSGTLDMRPSIGVLVRVTAALDRRSGLLTWDLLAINPATGEPASPLEGFLPPNTDVPDGQGGVTFTVMPRRALRTGAPIKAKASIVFNRNAAMATPTWTNVIDASAPTSRVRRVRVGHAHRCPRVNLSWSGRDRGAGVAFYHEYVATDHHRFRLWLSTRRARGVFKPEPGRHRYRFYSIAIDGVGHRQAKPSGVTRAVALSCAAGHKRRR